LTDYQAPDRGAGVPVFRRPVFSRRRGPRQRPTGARRGRRARNHFCAALKEPGDLHRAAVRRRGAVARRRLYRYLLCRSRATALADGKVYCTGGFAAFHVAAIDSATTTAEDTVRFYALRSAKPVSSSPHHGRLSPRAPTGTPRRAQKRAEGV